MKKTFKRLLSVILCLAMVLTMLQSALISASAKVVGPDSKTELAITADKSKYSWGDTIFFDVTVKNVTDEVLTGIKINSIARVYTKVSQQGELPVIPRLAPGESKTVRIEYFTTRLVGVVAIFLPIFWLFYPMSRIAYDETNFNYEYKAKVGLFKYRIGFEVLYNEKIYDEDGYYTDNGIVSFIDLKSDVNDIHINQTKSVTFYASMMAEKIIEDDVTLQCESSGTIGKLKDDGVAPDQVANDGVFTGRFDLKSSTRKNETYRAVCQDITSHPIDICFYKDLSQQEYNTFYSILDDVEELGEFNKILEYLDGNSSVESFANNLTNESITFTTTSGLTGVWQSNWNNQFKGSTKLNSISESGSAVDKTSSTLRSTLIGTSSNKNIAVVRPFRGSEFQYDNFRDCADSIKNEIGGTVTIRDDSNATISFMKSLDDYGIVMFDTHGALADVKNSAWHITSSEPYILIGEKMESVAKTFFDADWQSERIIVMASNPNRPAPSRCIAIGAKFFDKYYSEEAFDDTVFFLGSCYSMITNSIAETLVSKGASVVFGYSDVVSVGYCNNTVDEIMCQSMTQSASSARQGFNNAVNKYGDHDPKNSNTYLKIYGNGSYTIATDKGKLSGTVKSYTTKQSIRLAMIKIKDQNGNTVLTKYSSILNGSFEIKLPEGCYTVEISAYGYLTRTVYNIEITNGNTTYMSESAMLYPDSNPEIGGYVINTLTGNRVSGATIRFRRGHNQKKGAYIQTIGNDDYVLTSDSSGKYYTDKLPAGYYTAEINCDSFITTYVDVVAYCGCTNQSLNITPTIAANQIRIVLTWSSSPSDLDSHLVGPNAVRSGTFHTYFDSKTYSSNGIKYADLDKDDTDGYGPEQTTIYVKNSGIYSYYVHDYSNKESSNSTAMAKSGATVVVYMGNSVIATYYVPSNIDGTLWHVFDYNFDSSTITPINLISYRSDYVSIGS